ncbi:hypothetical protein W02_36900 [Nitrospira sp. KM1]|uniref:TonB-dependent receptor plug domain-containing protein n=1 Tax=Nitrospira sp. KM1 TaxID=1936990 RepID=UPI0013A74AFB|nr:Plug domain-containing protein [Nitrospira sp. KM1]BCA56550.1 hypothetical protein W02_36900 [Nitrospira sp. KM1]
MIRTKQILLSFLPFLMVAGLVGCTTTQADVEQAADQHSQTASQRNPCELPKTERTYVEPCTSFTSRNPDTPIKDIPGSVQVINRDLIEDQRALRIGDALRNVSGVQGGGGR